MWSTNKDLILILYFVLCKTAQYVQVYIRKQDLSLLKITKHQYDKNVTTVLEQQLQLLENRLKNENKSMLFNINKMLSEKLDLKFAEYEKNYVNPVPE